MRAAVALRYDPSFDDAPQVASVGRCELAREMERIARRYGVPIVEDCSLTARLIQVPVPEPIPCELYSEVALIFVQF